VLGYSYRSLQRAMRLAEDPLPYYRIGGRVLVRQDELEAWMARRRVKISEVGRMIDRAMGREGREPYLVNRAS